MDTNEPALPIQPQPVAGTSGARKRVRSSSSSSTNSSSSSSSSSSQMAGKKRHRRHRHKKNKRARRHSDPRMNKLVQDMGELQNIVTNFITSQAGNTHTACHAEGSICSEVSGELYEKYNVTDEQCLDDEGQNQNRDFTFDIETKLKEPAVPKTTESFLKKLLEVQRLGSASWSEVRYADTQKTYNHTPGFIDLETNEEVKTYDTLRHLAHADKAYAALTYCILKQKETLQEGIRNLLSWAKHTDVNFDNLSGKVEELFQKGDLQKVSSDLLQLVCGHRAESIEMRRETITSQVRDPLVKASLNRIPPSSTYIFESEPFTTALEKAGGVRKAFWPPKSDGFSQGKSNQSNSRPSRGQGVRKTVVPSRGTQCTYNEPGLPTHMHACNNPPSRGGYCHNNHFQYRGPPSNTQYENYNNGRGSFHNRGSRPDRGNNRGRSNAPRGSRGNQKRYKQ